MPTKAKTRRKRNKEWDKRGIAAMLTAGMEPAQIRSVCRMSEATYSRRLDEIERFCSTHHVRMPG